MTMDRKQRKAKKREEKLKQKKLREEKRQLEGLPPEEKTMGKVQLLVFVAVAAAGALFIIFNV